MTLAVVGAVVGSYLLGAIPTAQWVAQRAKGIDLSTVGSGNIGATNLYRVLGWKYAVPVFLFDTLKGVAPVAIIGPMMHLNYLGCFALGVVAVVGHVFSVFAGFRGGKGVATGGGVILGLAPGAFLIVLAIWFLGTSISGYVSLASILAAIALPATVWFTYPSRRSVMVGLVALALLVIWFHRKNIRRLLAGTESRFKKGPRADAPVVKP